MTTTWLLSVAMLSVLVAWLDRPTITRPGTGGTTLIDFMSYVLFSASIVTLIMAVTVGF